MEPATVVKSELASQLSDRVNRIAASPTMMVVQAADQLKSKGVDALVAAFRARSATAAAGSPRSWPNSNR